MVIRLINGTIVNVEGPANVISAGGSVVLRMAGTNFTVKNGLSAADATQVMSDLWDAWAPDGSYDATEA